jgi:hypothetical protein
MMLRVHDIAHWYRKRLHDKGDAIGQAITAQGEPVEWCAAGALLCCREAGCWLEATLADRYKLRSVEQLVVHARVRGLYVDGPSQALRQMATGRFGGLLATFPRDGKTYGHVGVVDMDTAPNWGSGAFGVVEFNTKDDTAFNNRPLAKATGFILVPRGGPLDN